MLKLRLIAGVLCLVFLCSSLFTSVAVAESSGGLASNKLWSYTAANTTTTTTRMSWAVPQIANGIVLIVNNEMFAVQDGGYHPYGQPQQLIQTLYALDADTGAKLWNVTDFSSIQEPIMVDGVVYFGASHHFYAVDAKTGAQKWVYDTGVGVTCEPCVVDGVIYVATNDLQNQRHKCYVSALDGVTGAELWKHDLGNGNYVSSLTVQNGVVFFRGPDRNLYALKAIDGTDLWNFSNDQSSASGLNTINNTVFFSTHQEFYTLNAQDGSKLWSHNTGSSLYGSPIIAEGVVYLNSPEPANLLACLYGNVYALDAASGDKLWNYSYPTRYSTMSHLEVVSNEIYFHSRDTLFALNKAEGSLRWSKDIGNVTSFTVDDRVVYYNSGNNLGALDAVNGDSVWSYTTTVLQSPVSAVDGGTYFGAGDTVYALGTSVSNQSWLDMGSTSTLLVVAVIIVLVAAIAVIALVKKRSKHRTGN